MILFSYDEAMTKFKELGLLVDGKPVNLTTFCKKCDLHVYGYYKGKREKIAFFHNSRESMFGFYLMNMPKRLYLKECYDMFKQMVAGDMSFMEYGAIQWGNCGIPLQYGNLRSIREQV